MGLQVSCPKQRVACAEIGEDPLDGIGDEHHVEVKAFRLVEGSYGDAIMLVGLVRQEGACLELFDLAVSPVLEQCAVGVALVPTLDHLGE